MTLFFNSFRWRWAVENSQKKLTLESDAALSCFLDAQADLPTQPFAEVPMIAIDLEMSGLDAKQNKILSLGCVKISNLEVDLNTARHLYIEQHSEDLKTTAPINHIFKEHLESGWPIKPAIEQLLADAKGCVPVFHHGALDLAFIEQELERSFSSKIPLYYLDTLDIEQSYLQRAQKPDLPLDLSSCKRRYNIPDHAAHNACTDARATAELLLAQIAHQGLQKQSVATKIRLYL